VAIDLSAAALEVARRNAEMHGVGEQIQFLEGDLLTPVAAEQKFDVVAANLPYIGQNEKGTLEEGVRRFEPSQALWGGPNGDELIVRLIPQAAERLVSGGLLVLEASPMIADRVAGHIKTDGRFNDATVANDLAGLARVIQARRT
jgi:release factor glutamine methyltransferase